jgi:DNA-binding LacI/PurR family transcriptional regulator
LKSGAQEFFIYEDSRNPWGGNSILCRSLQSQLIQAGVKKERIHYREKILSTRLRDMELLQELKKTVSDSAHKVLAFSSSDYFSLAIMKELQNTCLFGRKASLISFGGFECMMKSDPPVTSIVPDARQIGILAVEQILKNDMNAYAANCQTDYKIELNRTL